jgi:CRISPR-associated exonuclease Cas4
MAPVSAVFFFALAFAALVIWLRLQLARRREAVVIYSDTDTRRRGEILVSHHYRLTGRPDFLTRTRSAITPVELKSRNCGPKGPYPGERAQLLGYCLLAEDALGETVEKGLLEYPNRQFPITYGTRERQEIIALLEMMRALAAASDIQRNHHDPRRCRACGVRSSCGQSLG